MNAVDLWLQDELEGGWDGCCSTARDISPTETEMEGPLRGGGSVFVIGSYLEEDIHLCAIPVPPRAVAAIPEWESAVCAMEARHDCPHVAVMSRPGQQMYIKSFSLCRNKPRVMA